MEHVLKSSISKTFRLKKKNNTSKSLGSRGRQNVLKLYSKIPIPKKH